MDLICKYCGRQNFKRRSDFSYHQNRCEKKPGSNRYEKIHTKCVCEKCGKEFENGKYSDGIRRFCSSSCANSHKVSEEQKKKTSETLKAKSKSKFKPRLTCKDCNKELYPSNKSGYCIKHASKHRVITETQRERYREIGKQNAAKHGSRSKNEIGFFELVQKKFPPMLYRTNLCLMVGTLI